jgi:hypothetical protein
MDLYAFTWISIVFHVFERFWSQNVGRPLPPCGILWQPVASCRNGLDPISRFQILEAWIWRPGACMPGCLKDWNGWEEVTEVTEVTALWGWGIGRNSHTLKLQELGGSVTCEFQIAKNSSGLPGLD